MKFTINPICHGKMYLISKTKPSVKNEQSKYYDFTYYNFGCRKCRNKIYVIHRIKR
jgi:hypothetical protein